MVENQPAIIKESETNTVPPPSRLTSVMLKGLRFSSKFVFKAADFLVSVFTAYKANSKSKAIKIIFY